MESIKLLEKKLELLVNLVKELKAENKKLAKESADLKKVNADLEKNHETLELSLLKRDESFNNERTLTKEVVDDLIKSIDSLVG